MRRTALFLPLGLMIAFGCTKPDPLDAALPALPPTGGPPIAHAGLLTEANFAAEAIPGPASQGLVGDYFMRNDRIRLVIQRPGRAIGPCPYGGNVIDLDRVDAPAGDQLGEVSPLMQLGRTLDFAEAEVVRDGSQGGPAVLRFRGSDAMDDFINLPGLGGFVVAINDDYLARVELGLRAAVTYLLMPGESRLRMIYTLYNPAKLAKKTMWGSLSDTGAQLEIFHPYVGFGELSLTELISGSSTPLVPYAAFLGQGLAYGILPVFDEGVRLGSAVPVAGINAEAYDVRQALDPFGEEGQSLALPAEGAATRELQLILGRDLGEVAAQVSASRGEVTASLSGVVADAGSGGARVAVLAVTPADPAQAHLTTLSTDASGAFHAQLPPGRYLLRAEADGYRQGPSLEVDVPSEGIALQVPPLAPLHYTIRDRAGELIPGKVTVIGRPAALPDKIFRDVGKDLLPYGIAAWNHSRGGDASLGTRWDHPISVVPGRYRVVVSRGPEWSRVESVLDVGPEGARVDAVLDHVVPTPGYVSADFHQHSNRSPDSPVPPEDRIVTYLAEGVDLISSSEHDFVFDYSPFIDAAGARGLLDSAIGIETTTWDYGHYIGFPLTVDPLSPNGGAFDWGGGGDGIDNLPPPQIFAGLHQAGAQVVQVTHPRALPDSLSDFQASFDRAGLRFDFAGRTFYGDQTIQPLSALVLGIPEGQEMFSPDFEAHEVYNGFHLAQAGGEIIDLKLETNLRDWMNFLSFGFQPTPTGVSDTHDWFASPSGLPRTLVRVPDDSSAALAAGVGNAVAETVSGRAGARDVIVTNTPFIRFSVDGEGIGATVAHPGGPLSIHVEVQTPPWAPVDTVEIFANNSFDVPAPKGGPYQPLVPALCFTSRAAPSARCAQAAGGARPLVIQAVETVPGVPGSTRLAMVVDVDVDPDLLSSRQRAGASGRDLWLVARATGNVGLFPVIPTYVSPSVPRAELVDSLILDGRGVPALAMTNAIFVDVDGGGWRGPFSP